MKIVSWNVNGLRAVARKDTFKDVFALQPDVLCLQEIKATKEQLPDIVREVVGYHAYFNSSQEKKGYAGTAIYSKRKPITVQYDLPEDIAKKYKLEDDQYGDPNKEGRVLTVEFPELFVVTVYTPNTKDTLERLSLRHTQWDPAFLEYCVTLQSKKPVVFCGDLNVAHMPIDLARPKENEGRRGYTQEEREGIDTIISEGFGDTLRILHPDTPELYTWWSPWSGARQRNVGWRLDYLFASESIENVVTDATVHTLVMGSDHCPVSASFSL